MEIIQEKNKRIPISKKLRFEVFKRDSFKCQYCGKSAPDVILHVDHINPVKRGGKNDITNLITACSDCNLGKGATTLDDKSVVEKQKNQLDELNERREQLKLMTKWRDELLKIEEDQVNYINERIQTLVDCTLSQHGRNGMKSTIKKFGFELVLDSIEKSANQYLQYENDEPTKESIDKFITYVPKICAGTIAQKEHPEIKKISYICGIARNRFTYYDKAKAWQLLKRCYDIGMDIEELKDLAKEAKNWSEFYHTLEYWAN